MDDITAARAVHVLSVLHWIGGVAFVTLVLLPSLRRNMPATEQLRIFELFEGRFAKQARISTLLAGGSGFYMVHQMNAWDRLTDFNYWWMHAMIALWVLFTVLLFLAEPLFLHRWFRESSERDPEGTSRLLRRMHVILISASFAVTASAVLGSHGYFS